MVMGFYIGRRTDDEDWEDHEFQHGLSLAICGICAPFCFPIVATCYTSRKLFLGDNTLNMTRFTQYKLVENFCESLPQLIISIVFIVNNPDQLDVFNYLSVVISAGSVLFGLLISGKSCYDDPPNDFRKLNQSSPLYGILICPCKDSEMGCC